jgi:predicted RNA-binding Zn-ribbon protein involved in translation (DUF1610 family)
MIWYRLVKFKCPVCGQRLAVFGAQVERGETVACQNCNTDIRLSRKGEPPPARAPGEPAWRVVELPG